MHVYYNGEWHRRTPDLQTTACGRRFNSQFSRLRREELTHPLARCCFTDHEIEKADEKKKLEDQAFQMMEIQRLADEAFEEQPTSRMRLVESTTPLEGEDK